ncbi:TetR/AcrR family transcriptional regulator [Desertihabitans brevis]|nr:TetR/AcrR family transcriptional regulator [Desertihabitans brevis]
MPSAATTRTRQAVVEAAVACWSTDPSASLGEVAARAGVGRSTLNRHFSGRAELVAAVDQLCRERFRAAAAGARPEEGTGLEALQRLALALLELRDLLGLVFGDDAPIDPDSWEDDEHAELEQVLRRGYADGSLAGDLPPEWLATVLWTTLFGAWLLLREGRFSSHEVGTLMIRTLARGVGSA